MHIRVYKDRTLASLASEYRLPVTRLSVVALLLLVLLSGDSWSPDGWGIPAFRLSGAALVVLGTVIRLWGAVYLAGHHDTKQLATQGPYSMVRNPLYLGSLLGVMGLGLITRNLLVLSILGALFGLYYPLVILNEERGLDRTHGEAYRKYARRTPRFLPRPSLFQEPSTIQVGVRMFRTYLVDSSWFLWGMILLELVVLLHDRGVLPVLLRIP